MAYINDMTVHDADSHVMELPTKIIEYLDAKYHDDFMLHAKNKIQVPADIQRAIDKQEDPDFQLGHEANLMLRKNYLALGAFRNSDRPQTLNMLGFSSQLVFTTAALGNYGLEETADTALALAVARAHNRMNADFCSVDKRLLATGYVPLVDLLAAADIAREAIELGCKALMIPSKSPTHHSPSHSAFEPLWAIAQEAGIPIVFHVGGEEKMADSYFNNGLPPIKDFHGGDENFTGLSFMTIPLSVWQTMAALIFDGVCDRFPQLKFGAIELGASWLPSWLQFMDSAWGAFSKGEVRLQNLSAKPSEIAARQFRVTPYAHESTGWIMDNSSADMLLFSSDFPHVEGGRNPIKRFNENMLEVSEQNKRKFYRDNFINLMGAGLDKSLHDHPSIESPK
ncbi:MAG: amidohydrolase [Gammaproteobacteria bacterium]|nr:amidohydrolase [Gammaproteobacteria bacterium]